MIEKVREFVANDRNASLKMMEEALNISSETIRTILHEYLGKTKVCAKFPSHTSVIVRQFLARYQVCTLNHPPYSPDLTPCGFSIETEAEGAFF